MNWKNDFAQAEKLLRNQGNFVFLTSSTWLNVGYGRGLKKFFLDNFRILALIEMDSGVFGDELVHKCAGILKREEDPLKRDKNLVRFIRLKKTIKISKIIKILLSVKSNQESKEMRIVVKPQNTLAAKDRWGKYFIALAV